MKCWLFNSNTEQMLKIKLQTHNGNVKNTESNTGYGILKRYSVKRELLYNTYHLGNPSWQKSWCLNVGQIHQTGKNLRVKTNVENVL